VARRSIARPEVTGNEVLVKVHAAGLDRDTWHHMAGELTPVIDKTYPLHQAPEAMRDLEAGHAQGSSSSR
jgi:NADPH:quinone reductase-like Zn-dependent oxidoreductase